ncbi:hypothetical protein TREMEDRAFT_38450 [Tremella mesenterica DSM 1558]|uniref:uncharacterized protein n=1 Tax=Tremella mesenterica (strain ATCC 24925 / CBS 8224 / DSM 1558 / NBRC 9311 / NRRL Y-6157 / RJB 2259-6 / UBC 559-6) TaxID=578456 RepID=UPI0003F48C2B|nr:uncharacterized protein TREMEDRAFT_38450 [Tremella mesenterica DSM 1558]EIW70877.1 hypothetical protein TREMEDRAFT_38450 [Tremella mesenterica DSM 1558]
MSVVTLDQGSSPGPFEGPEKLLEVWFAPSPDALPTSHTASKLRKRADSTPDGTEWKGLRCVPREVWEEMLNIVRCKVLSVVEGKEIDAYLLSESSLFVAPHLLILKTCGTTLNLLGLYRIIHIAREYCGFTKVWRCFYSRKSFFFPERQQGPHRDWRDEVTFLDSVFGSVGSAYTVGPMNRDHWLLYLTSPNSHPMLPGDEALSSTYIPSLPSPGQYIPSLYQDTTLEILMTHLSPQARSPFFSSSFPSTSSNPSSTPSGQMDDSEEVNGHELGKTISKQLGIDRIFPDETTLDSFGFTPCGYSANGVIGSGSPFPSTCTKKKISGSSEKDQPGGYFTIHVTPEEGWSYASFECNVPLPSDSSPSSSSPSTPITPVNKSGNHNSTRPTLPQLIRTVVNIFQPFRLSITLFVSTPTSFGPGSEAEQRAWNAFGSNLLGETYERKDRIGYEFDGYDLVFACFERKGWKEVKTSIQ